MLIAGGRVFTRNGFIEADLLTKGPLIVGALVPGSCAVDEFDLAIDAKGRLVCPGLVDLHFHGCVGSDFCDGTVSAIHAIARHEASCGVTALCPATMTYPEERLGAIVDAAAQFTPAADEASLVGINMEGPFISPNKVGAQNPAYVQACDADMVQRLQERSGGLLKLVDVAPEEPGALEFIRKASPTMRISLAHTCADYNCAREAFDAGARQMTHLYNAMPILHHRNPGPIAAAAERDDVVAEIIADGVHVHPAMVRLAFRLFGGRLVLISDSMRACGLGEGTFDLGGQDVIVDGQVARLPDGTITGSVSDLATCVRIAVNNMGIDPWEAVNAASYVPACALGISEPSEGGYGRLDEGCVANIVLFDEDMNVADVILRGNVLGKS